MYSTIGSGTACQATTQYEEGPIPKSKLLPLAHWKAPLQLELQWGSAKKLLCNHAIIMMQAPVTQAPSTVSAMN
jgi:hypothetical protein